MGGWVALWLLPRMAAAAGRSCGCCWCSTCAVTQQAACLHAAWPAHATLVMLCSQSRLPSVFTAMYRPSVPQEKERLKREKDEAEAKYKYAMVDGRQETVSCWGGSGAVAACQTCSVLTNCCTLAQETEAVCTCTPASMAVSPSKALSYRPCPLPCPSLPHPLPPLPRAGGQLPSGASRPVPWAWRAPQDGQAEEAHLPPRHHHQHRGGLPRARAPLRRWVPGLAAAWRAGGGWCGVGWSGAAECTAGADARLLPAPKTACAQLSTHTNAATAEQPTLRHRPAPLQASGGRRFATTRLSPGWPSGRTR